MRSQGPWGRQGRGPGVSYHGGCLMVLLSLQEDGAVLLAQVQVALQQVEPCQFWHHLDKTRYNN